MRASLLLMLLPAVYFSQERNADSLREKESNIQEVVLTGFQKIEKSKVTSAVSAIKMKDVEQKATASVDQMLQGKIAGVMVTPQSGTPGQIAPIRIRGTASLSGPVDPLWVIDGVPLDGNAAPDFKAGQDINLLKNYSIAGINPDDIENITVLKDASATAIYGARAANGVILVTTKNGKKGQMNVNLSSNTFVSFRPDFSRLNLMNSNQKVDFELAMAAREDLDGYRASNGAVARILNENGDLQAYREGGFVAISALSQQQINNLRSIHTNWGKLLYRTPVNQQHTLSLSGGSDIYKYYASFGYYNEQSTVIGDEFARYNLTLKNSIKFSPKVNVNISVFGTQTDQKSFLSDSGSYTSPAFYSRTANPYLSPFDKNGNYVYDYDINYIERLSGDEVRIPYNFLEERNNTNHKLVSQSVKTILDFNYKVLKALEYRMQLGLQFDNNKTERYASQETYFLRKLRANSLSGDNYIIPLGDFYNTVNDHGFAYNFKNILEYNPRFGKHDFDFLAGSEIRRTKYNGVNSKMYGYNPKSKTSIPLNIPDSSINDERYLPVKDYETENAYASFFGTASYTYDNRYTLFGSVRYDGTNMFGAEIRKRWNPIWAVSGAWNVKNEAFLKDNNTVSMLKLRASYGLQGNIDRNTSPFFTGKYRTTKILNTTEDIINDEGAPNPLLRWEKTATTNLGLDFGLWHNRLNFNFDVYNRKGSDILGYKELAFETGFNTQAINWAKISNKGVEFSVASTNISSDKFTWATTFNIAANRSNIDLVQNSKNPFLPSGQGLPINAVFGIRTAGLDENGLPMFLDKSGNKVSAVDFYKLFDPWADFYPGALAQSALSTEEMRDMFVYLGDRDPKYFGGFSNNFKYKNWDLGVTASFNIKQTVVANPPYNFVAVDRGLNFTTDILDAWSPTNTSGILPRIIGLGTLPGEELVYNYFTNGDDSRSYSYFSNWTKEISFMRINSVKLGYALPDDFLKNSGLKYLRLTLEGRNLAVFGSDYKGYFDPETYGNIYASPIQKSVVFGLNVGF